MRFKDPKTFHVFRFYPPKIVIPIYMDKILAKLDIVSQKTPSASIAKIDRSERVHFLRIYR